MKLLFDHNISPDLVRRLRDLFPGSDHVFHLNLHEEDDLALWTYAGEHGFIVVSKDADFSELSMVFGCVLETALRTTSKSSFAPITRSS